GRIEDAQPGMGVEPADDVQLRIAAGAVTVDLGPGIGGESEVHGAVIVAERGEGGLHLHDGFVTLAEGMPQQHTTYFPAQVAASMVVNLNQRLLVQKDARLAGD